MALYRKEEDGLKKIAEVATKESIGLSKVENKSSEEIRDEITSKNVTDALGYTPASEEELNKKTDKTTIETVTSDANIVTIPDNVKDFGMINMVGGKTVKSKNLIPFPYFRPSGFTVGGVTYTYDNDGVITVTNSTPATANGYFTLIDPDVVTINAVSGKTYTLSAKSSSVSSKVKFRWYYRNRATKVERGGTNDFTNASLTFTFEPNENEVLSIQLYTLTGANPGNEVITIQLEEGSEATEYEPYFDGLHNAPVEKIVIVGRNRIMNTLKHLSINTDGSLYSSSATTNYDIHIVKVTSGQTYSFTKGTDAYVYAFYSSYPNIGDISYDGSRVVGGNGTVTAPIDGYLCFRTMTGFKANCEIGDSISDIPEPYTEITISLSDLLDLPDYGCSTGDVYNYVDFENMVYHHKARKIDATKLNWQLESGKGYYSNDFKNLNIIKTSANMLSDKYSYSTTLWESMCFGVNQNGTFWTGDISASPSTFDKFEIVFELATEELIDLKPIFTILPVEANGTIEFVNEHKLLVPNTVKYQKGAE